MISDERLRAILDTKDHEDAMAATIANPAGNSECWRILDGCLVIYDETDVPNWLQGPIGLADENGQTPLFRLQHDISTT